MVLCILGVVFAEPLVLMCAWSWKDDPEQLARAATMTRWMFPFVGMVSAVSYFEGLLNYRGHFFVPKFAPAMVSIGIVAAALFLADRLGPATALVVGTMGGGLLHVLINVPVLRRRWGPLGFRLDLHSPRLRAVTKEMSKVVAIGVFGQINVVVLRQLGTALGPGAITHYWNANRLTDLAQGIVAVAIGSALLPNVAASIAEASWDRFRAELGQALRLAAFLLLPVGATLLAFAVPITAMLFRLGAYTWEDVLATASALRLMTPFILGVAASNILKKVFFALDERTTLIVVGAAGTALTLFLGWFLVGPFGVGGLSLALSIATLAQVAVYVLVLWRRLGDWLGVGLLAGPLLRMALACGPVALVLVLAQPFGRWERGPFDAVNVTVFVLGGATAWMAYFAAAWVLGVPETGGSWR